MKYGSVQRALHMLEILENAQFFFEMSVLDRAFRWSIVCLVARGGTMVFPPLDLVDIWHIFLRFFRFLLAES